VALLVGGKMTFPGLSVRDNLRIGGHILRKDRPRAARAMAEAMDAFPELKSASINRPARLSGGEQQMLAGPHHETRPAYCSLTNSPWPGPHDGGASHGHGAAD